LNAVILPVVLPLLAAFLMQPLAQVSARAARLLGPLTLAASLVLLLQAWPLPGSEPMVVTFAGFLPPMGIIFYVDRLALTFAVAVPIFTLLSWGWVNDPGKSEKKAREDALMLLMAAAATGLSLSGDLFNMFVCYELVALSSFGLVILKGTGPAHIATLRYLLISAFGSLLALLGIAILYAQTGTLNLAQIGQLAPVTLHNPPGLLAFAFMLLGFGVKAELFPVNTWVPEVYATAPARIAGLLAGLVSKLAALVVLRLLVVVYQGTSATELLLVLGALTVLFGDFSAWRSQDFPRMISYSSIAQLGLVFIGFSLPGPWGILAGLSVALHHLFVKTGMFNLATRWPGAMDSVAGDARHSPVAAGLYLLFALSLTGIPPLPGFWAKFLVVVGLAQQGSSVHLAVLAAVLLGSILKAHYLFRFAVKLYATNAEPQAPGHSRWRLGVAALIGIAVCATALYAVPLGERLRATAHQAADRDIYIRAVFPEDTETPAPGGQL
jgi:formate hydrogenlyase subunit 3/multisubunit Na+/H+ antiporter MnhD subunit